MHVQLNPRERIVYDALCAAAEADRPCPTQDDLADALGGVSLSTTVAIMQRLERLGLIITKVYQRSRQVVILATGRATRAPKSTAVHWRHRPRDVPAPSIATLRDREREPGTAEQLLAAARREGRSPADFLGDLVWAGWRSYLGER